MTHRSTRGWLGLLGLLFALSPGPSTASGLPSGGMAPDREANLLAQAPSHMVEASGTRSPGASFLALPGRTAEFSLSVADVMPGTAANMGTPANPDDRWSDEFALANACSGGFGASVRAVVRTPDGLIYVGGSFSSCGGVAASNIARYDPVNRTWSALGAPGSGVNGPVAALAIFNGPFLPGVQVIVGGAFTHIQFAGGSVASRGIARFNGTSLQPLFVQSGGVTGAVDALAVFNGLVYIAGQFSQAGSTTANSIVTWNGSEFTTFFRVGSGGGNGVNGAILSMAVSGSELIVGGNFTEANVGAAVPAHRVARWNGSTWSALGSAGNEGVNGLVRTLAASPAGLYVGGEFTEANVGNPVAANRIARWDGSAWSALGSGGGNGVSGGAALVDALAVSGDDLYVGGSFSQINAGAGLPANNIGRWTGAAWSTLGSGANNAVLELVVLDADTLYAGGAFTSIGGRESIAIGRYRLRGTLLLELGGSGSGNVSSSPVGIDCPGSCSATFDWDRPITLTTSPGPGSAFAGWSGGTCSGTGGCVLDFDRDTTVVASFVLTQATLSYTAGPNGSIVGAATQLVNLGQSGTPVEAVPNIGYGFAGWSDGITANPRTDTNVTGNLSVTASFAINQYTLSYGAGANGSISGAAMQTVTHGGSGTPVQAVPNPGFNFVSWSDGVTANPRTDTNVTGNLSVTASFAINQYTLSYSAGANGSISGAAMQTVTHGGSGTPVQAVPNPGFNFVSWSDGVTANPRTDANVTTSLSVAASFAGAQFSVTASVVGANGSIAPTSQIVNFGTSAILSITPSPGYGTALPMGGSCPAGSLSGTAYTTGPIEADCTVIGSFIQNAPAILSIAGGTDQNAPAFGAFPLPLAVRVADAQGVPLAGINVTFAAPGSGASAVLSSTSVATDAMGLATVLATANGVAGTYSVIASVGDLSASFSLVNRALTSTLALTASPVPVTPGATVVLTATVSGMQPSGSVTFTAGSAIALCADVPLLDGVATCTAGPFPLGGSLVVTARYAGDAAHAPSEASLVLQALAPVMIPTLAPWGLILMTLSMVLVARRRVG